MFTSSFLKDLRSKVVRKRLWFKVLNSFDRSFYNLTCSIVSRVESLVLGKEIMKLVLVLKNALKGEFVRFVESYGVRKAWIIAQLSVAWGYNGARNWKYDQGLARLHALNEYNGPSGWSSTAGL